MLDHLYLVVLDRSCLKNFSSVEVNKLMGAVGLTSSDHFNMFILGLLVMINDCSKMAAP